MASVTSAESTSEKHLLTLFFSETISRYDFLQLEEPGRGSPSVEGAARPHWIPQLLQVSPHHHPPHPPHSGQDHPSHPHHGGQYHPLDDTDHEGQDPTHSDSDDSGDMSMGQQKYIVESNLSCNPIHII